MAGFGRSPFGRGPFGRSDLGQDLLINLFPEEYFDDSIFLSPGESVKENNKDPLLKVLKVYKNSVNARKAEIENISDLLDYEKASTEIVRLWGELLGLGIDKNDPEFLQRSFLGNASQWLQLKGSTRGYQVRGLASGFTVEVQNFWRIDPVYSPLIPERFKHLFKPRSADPTAQKILHTDAPPGTYPGTPLIEDPTYAKSAYVRITLEIAGDPKPFIDYNELLNLIISKIRDVVAIHHELLPLIFQIRMSIPVPITANISIEEEIAPFNFMVHGVYDIEAADVHETDLELLTAEILPVVSYSWGVSASINASMEIGEEVGHALAAGVVAAHSGASELTEIGVNVGATSEFVLGVNEYVFAFAGGSNPLQKGFNVGEFKT